MGKLKERNTAAKLMQETQLSAQSNSSLGVTVMFCDINRELELLVK